MKKFAVPLILFSTATVLFIGSVGGDFSSRADGHKTNLVTGAWEKSLVINEVYYDTAQRSYLGEAGVVMEKEGSNEWVELYNPNFYAVNAKGYKVGDFGSEFTIGTGAKDVYVPAHGFLVLTHDDATWRFWPGKEMVMLNLGGNVGNGWLNNAGEWVYLKNEHGVIVDQMGYGSTVQAFDPACPDVAEGHSLERATAGKDTNSAADFVDRAIPTPSF